MEGEGEVEVDAGGGVKAGEIDCVRPEGVDCGLLIVSKTLETSKRKSDT